MPKHLLKYLNLCLAVVCVLDNYPRVTLMDDVWVENIIHRLLLMKRLLLSNEKQIKYKQHYYSFQIKNTAIGRLTQTRNINEILCKQGENIFANYLHRRPLDICMMYQ